MTEEHIYEDCVALIRTPFAGEVGKSMPVVAELHSISFWQNTSTEGAVRCLVSRVALDVIREEDDFEVLEVSEATDEVITEMFEQHDFEEECC